jgi:hypothetical protein
MTMDELFKAICGVREGALSLATAETDQRRRGDLFDAVTFLQSAAVGIEPYAEGAAAIIDGWG